MLDKFTAAIEARRPSFFWTPAIFVLCFNDIWVGSAAAQQIETAAFAGQPFGVARIRYGLPAAAISDSSPSLSSPRQQLYYPVVTDVTSDLSTADIRDGSETRPRLGRGRLLGRIADLVRKGIEAPQEKVVVGREIWFLFQGAEPFTVEVKDGSLLRMTITPTSSALGLPSETAWNQAMMGWWDVYTRDLAQRVEAGDYPPLVENYLASMLSRRLDFPLPESLVAKKEPEETSITTVLQLVGGAESMRNRTFMRVAQGDTEQFSSAEFPLPETPSWRSSEVEAVQPNVVLEDLSRRVPLDSFYIRFGSFDNYLWFRKLGNRFGGDVSRMITLRGFDYGATKRVETQLQVQATELSLLLGSSVVEDMAIVGHDLFLTEGASIGVLMKAKNAFLLGTSLRNDRASVLQKVPNAAKQDLTIAGKTVNLLSTPDNRIRSYLAFDGPYALISNSETLVREFLETGHGGPSLADSEAFQYARQLMPNENAYKIFAYFSDEFFQGLVSPKYQIELRRRLNATADIELIHLARLAALSEGKRDYTELDQLISAGYLPEGIGQRPDGSGPILAGDEVIDSRRGMRGYFLPIADVEINQITKAEFDWYEKQATYYEDNWQEMDPLVVGLREIESPNEGLDRFAIHAEIVPLVPKKYGWIAEQLGPPTTEMIKFGPSDIAAVQAYVVSDKLGGVIPPHHLFGALKDAVLPNPAELDGLLDKFRAIRSLSGYIGAWPEPGLLDRLPLGLGRGRPVGPGMTKLLVGLYRFQGSGFSIISFVPQVITESLPHLEIVDAIEPAQVRLHVDNLAGTKIEGWINDQFLDRSFQASRAGATLLNSLVTQLHVPAADAKATAERLLDARLQCPLGGEYVLAEIGTGRETVPSPAAATSSVALVGDTSWVSTAWAGAGPGGRVGGFEAPIMSWFGGLSGRLTQFSSRLVADFTLDIKDDL